MQSTGSTDEFDGHGDYLAEFEPYDQELGWLGTPWRALDSLIAFVVFWAVMFGVCPDGCLGPTGPLLAVGGLIAGVLASGIFIAAVRAVEHQWKARLGLELAIVLVIAWHFTTLIRAEVSPENEDLGSMLTPMENAFRGVECDSENG